MRSRIDIGHGHLAVAAAVDDGGVDIIDRPFALIAELSQIDETAHQNIGAIIHRIEPSRDRSAVAIKIFEENLRDASRRRVVELEKSVAGIAVAGPVRECLLDRRRCALRACRTGSTRCTRRAGNSNHPIGVAAAASRDRDIDGKRRARI